MKTKRFLVVLGVLILTLGVLTVTLALADTGGPDGYGYVYIDSQEPNGPAYDWVDISGTGTSYFLGDDQSTAALNLGFTFNFYGNDFTQMYADSNGYISFTSGQGGDFSNQCPVIGDVLNFVGPYWDDLDPGDDGAPLYHQNFAAGSCPYNGYAGACSVVQWEEFDFFPGDGNPGGTFGTFEAILFDNHQILYQYEDINDTGTSASIGIGNDTGSIELMYGCNAGGTTTSGRSVLFAVLAPDISVDPSSVESTQAPDEMVTLPLNITNNGDADLTWEILEQIPANVPPIPTGPVEKQQYQPLAPTGNAAPSMMDEQVQDGGFEAGSPNPYWTEFSTNFGTPLCTSAGCGVGGGTGPNSGTWWTWFGGIAGAYEAGSVSQMVTIPISATDMTWYQELPVCSGAAGDYMELNIDGNQEYVIYGNDASCGTLAYTQISLDVSAYADGGSHTIEFYSETFGSAVMNFFIDDVSLDAPEPPVPGQCVTTDEIPWLTAAPITGTTAVSSTDVVNLTFDSTGYSVGVYTGTLCVASNDLDTPEVLVPVTMTVESPPTAVSLTGFGGDTAISLNPIWLAVTLVLIVGLGLAIRRKLTA